MQSIKLTTTMLAIVLGFAVQAAADDTGALAAIDALAQAMRAQDTTAVEAAFTEDAGYSYSLDGELNRGDSFDAWLTSDIIGPGSVFEIEGANVSGGTVDAQVVWGRDGNASTPARYVFDVTDGGIDSWRMVGR